MPYKDPGVRKIRVKEIGHNWYIANKDRKREQVKAWELANPDKVREKVLRAMAVTKNRYHSDPVFREKCIAARKKWYLKNRKLHPKPRKTKEEKRARRKAWWENYKSKPENQELIRKRKDRQKEYHKQKRIENGGMYALRSRRARLKEYYGITIDGYNNLFNQQNGRCASCGLHQSELRKKLSVDHCHKSGKVRGLLCGNCNLGLGNFKDDIEILKLAIIYLNKHAYSTELIGYPGQNDADGQPVQRLSDTPC